MNTYSETIQEVQQMLQNKRNHYYQKYLPFIQIMNIKDKHYFQRDSFIKQDGCRYTPIGTSFLYLQTMMYLDVAIIVDGEYYYVVKSKFENSFNKNKLEFLDEEIINFYKIYESEFKHFDVLK
jgi:hypothetical protein